MQFKLKEINGIKDLYHCNFENETMSKTLSKYIADFHYVNKTIMLVLPAALGGVSMAMFVVTVIGATVVCTNNKHKHWFSLSYWS